jgi:hypothetical protein
MVNGSPRLTPNRIEARCTLLDCFRSACFCRCVLGWTGPSKNEAREALVDISENFRVKMDSFFNRQPGEKKYNLYFSE